MLIIPHQIWLPYGRRLRPLVGQIFLFVPAVVTLCFGMLEVSADTSMDFFSVDFSASAAAYLTMTSVLLNFVKGKAFTVVVTADMLLKLMLALEKFKVRLEKFKGGPCGTGGTTSVGEQSAVTVNVFMLKQN